MLPSLPSNSHNQSQDIDSIPLKMPLPTTITNKLLITLLKIKLRTLDTITVNSLHQEPTGKHGVINQPEDSTVETELQESKTPVQWTHTDKKLFTPCTTLETDGPIKSTAILTSDNELKFILKYFQDNGYHLFKTKIINFYFHLKKTKNIFS